MSDFSVKYNSRYDNISSWGVFLLSAIVYLLTIDHSASFWDCPEYITCASRLEVGHPPGNPVWMLAMRFATMFFPTGMHAVVINACSALFMAFASFFLARITYALCLYTGINSSHCKSRTSAKILNVIAGCCAFTAGTCFSFCDSAWFSAVEAEVYAMSACLTTLSIWLMIMWAREPSESRGNRLLILVAYITGLSLGVHQLNLLCIPVFAIIYVFRRYPRHATRKAWTAIILSLGVVGVILIGIMQGVLSWAICFELLAVNCLRLPYFTGVIAFALLLCIAFPIASLMLSRGNRFIMVTALFFSIWLSGAFVFRDNIILGGGISLVLAIGAVYVIRLSRESLLTFNWMTAFVLLGYSSFALILIRGYASPPMNEAAPTDIFALQSYISRDQYGAKPLFYGATPYSKPMLREEWTPGNPHPSYSRYALKGKKALYAPYMPEARLYPRSGMMTGRDSAANSRIAEDNRHGYIVTDHSFSRVTTPELDMVFPRITGNSPYDIESYADWAGMDKETMSKVKISEAFDTLGNPVGRMLADGSREEKYSWRPTYLQHLNLFISYQAYYMYFRYVLWNFLGRQNDIHSTGEIEHGNFITGVPLIDNIMLGDQSLLPAYAGKDNPGRHVYFGLPFILGVLGFCYLFTAGSSGKRSQAIITLMFLMTGLAIVVYLNQTPGEARERDYSFLGSYMAFCIWIGFGIMWLLLLLRRIRNLSDARIFAPLCAVITLAAPCVMVAQNYKDHQRAGRSEPLDFATDLLSMHRPAIIFSYGDNHTFPLWYGQETEGIGKQHMVIDVSYFTTPAYVVNLMKQNAAVGCFTATPADIAYGAYAFTRIAPDADTVPVPLIQALKELYADKSGAAQFRHSKVLLLGNDMADTLTVSLRSLTSGGLLPFQTLMLLDLIATNNESKDPKPLIFLYPIKKDFYKAVSSAIKNGYGYHSYDPNLSDSCYRKELSDNLKRSLERLKAKTNTPYYRDPIITDHDRRQRGNMVITAQELLREGDTISPAQAIAMIERHYPYTEIPAGSMTVADTTFYEGIAYTNLLKEMASKTTGDKYAKMLQQHTDLIKAQKSAWERYYRSLSPRQRHAVSNSTRRILTSPNIN